MLTRTSASPGFNGSWAKACSVKVTVGATLKNATRYMYSVIFSTFGHGKHSRTLALQTMYVW